MKKSIVKHIDKSIAKAISFLAKSQSILGGFPSYWSESNTMSKPTIVESPFITGMILLTLSSIKSKSTRIPLIIKKGCVYLQTKRKDNGYFAFFDEGLDCDLDDTCLLNAILQDYDKDKSYYYSLATNISKMYLEEDGLYSTWIRNDPQHDNDKDMCVNVNIVRFLEFNGISCNETIQRIRDYLSSSHCLSPTIYYASCLSFPYLIYTLPVKIQKKVINGSCEDNLKVHLERFLEDLTKLTINDIAMGLFICSANNWILDKCEHSIQMILKSQETDGSWAASAAFQAFNFWGSPELTTAIVIQALWSYSSIKKRFLMLEY